MSTTRVNLLMLPNPTVVNLLDGCAVSVPVLVLRVAAWIEERA
jgi:hypothetical protein